MKKILFVTGFGVLAYGLYSYFKSQVNLALNYNYNIDDFKILNLTDERADISATIKLENKSSFEIEVLNYDVTLYYDNITIGSASSGQPFKIYAENSMEISATGSIIFDEAKKAALPLVQKVLQRKPIDFQVSGSIKVKFLGIPYTLSFDKEKFNYSMDLLQDLGLSEKYEKLQSKLPILRKI